jgi:hypothetical protein
MSCAKILLPCAHRTSNILNRINLQTIVYKRGVDVSSVAQGNIPPTDHRWAFDLMTALFREKIENYFTQDHVVDRVVEKARYGDDLYDVMFKSVGRDQYLSMLTYWSVGQGVGVQVRRWVEQAIQKLVLHQKDHFGREIQSVYTLEDLKGGQYSRSISEADLVALAGEDGTEHSQRRTWMVPLRRPIVSAADRMADVLLSDYRIKGSDWPWHKVPPDEIHKELPGSTDELLSKFPVRNTQFQRRWLTFEALAVKEAPISRQRLICNLLVVEKPPGKVCAFRFASPALSSLRGLCDEKRNLLLLYGWLRQEKPFRARGDSVEVHWAHLMDRPATQSQEFFFGLDGIMKCDDFWAYLGVPYQALLDALAEAGGILKRHISRTLRKATAGSIRRLKFDSHYRDYPPE